MWTPEQLALLPHDNGGTRLVASIWCLAAFSAVFLALRLYCKVSRHNRLWWDDYMLIAAWVRHLPSSEELVERQEKSED